MAVNPELVGRAFPPTAPYLVGREKVREFSRAVFATSPINLDPAAARAVVARARQRGCTLLVAGGQYEAGMDQLLEIGWVRMRGRRKTPGRPVTYGTTDDCEYVARDLCVIGMETMCEVVRNGALLMLRIDPATIRRL